jgi:hypothetical protein
MNFKSILRRLVPMRWQKPSSNEPLSIVLLLRRPHLFSADDLRLAAEKAWSTPLVGGDSSMHCVVQSEDVTLMKAGPHLLNFLSYPNPYIDNPKENIEWLPQARQRQAWIEHSACFAVDYMNRETDVEVGYCVLSKLVAEMLDENCTGIYIPRESSLIPNDASLYRELQKMASSRDSAVRVAPNSRFVG